MEFILIDEEGGESLTAASLSERLQQGVVRAGTRVRVVAADSGDDGGGGREMTVQEALEAVPEWRVQGHGGDGDDALLSLAQVRALGIDGDVQVWKQGMRDWVRADACPELRPAPDPVEEEERREQKRQKRAAAALWRKLRKADTDVYVTGLPLDATVEEVKEHFSRAGLIKERPETGAPRIKLYEDDEGKRKGDGLVSYLRPESVDIALQVLDGSYLRPKGDPIQVQKAKYELKDTIAALPVKKRKLDVVAQARADRQKRLLSWNEDVAEGLGLFIVILKGVFTQQEADEDEDGRPAFFVELREEVGAELERTCGAIEKMVVFEDHPDGVLSIRFKSDVAAERCVQDMNGRFFAGRRITAEYYDGHTNYKKGVESKEAEDKRVDEFGKWLEEEDEGK